MVRSGDIVPNLVHIEIYLRPGGAATMVMEPSELSASNSSSFNPKHASGGSYHRPCHLGCLISVKKISMASLLSLQRCFSDSWCRSSDVAKKRVKTTALALLCLKSQRLKDNRVVSASNGAGITSCLSLT